MAHSAENKQSSETSAAETTAENPTVAKEACPCDHPDEEGQQHQHSKKKTGKKAVTGAEGEVSAEAEAEAEAEGEEGAAEESQKEEENVI